MKDIRQRLLATFHVEHKEHVQRIREALTVFEQLGGKATGPDLDDVFRRAHSLKGAARAVDLRPLEHLAHRLETLFSRIREGALGLDKPVRTVVAQALDASEDWLASMAEGRVPAAPEQALEAIDRLLGTASAATPAKVMVAVVAPAAVDRPAEPPASPASAVVPLAALATVRLHADSLDRMINSAGQLLTESLRQGQVSEQLRHLRGHLAETAVERTRARKAGARAFRKLDSLPELAAAARYVNYLDHQVHVLSKLVGTVGQLQERNAWTLRTLAGDLQRDVRRARMVPVEDVFEGFRKMVRDLAKDEGKAIGLHAAGWQVEADRMVLQALKDPVMHMVRNAVSHGIEPAADRIRLGKDPTGRIDLMFEARGNQLRVVVEDDGRGVDLARVAEIAMRKGLIKDSEIAGRSPAELMRLVLLPGFSTTRFVTELSGRGMGLSVVAEAVARLQGTVDLGPGRQGGTMVTLSAPLSVSSHRLLLVACQGQTFAIPVHGIERLHRIALAEVKTVEARPVVTIDGEALAVVSLAHLVNAGAAAVSVDQGALCVMVMRAGLRRVAVAVDAFLSERDAIIKDLPAAAGGNGKIAGGILLADGSVCLVLNPAELVDGSRPQADALVLTTAGTRPAEAALSPEILVVDDSLTTRTLEKSILEAHGYRVAIAVDGVEALNYLRAETVGLVITDLEMPRLDGFELLEEMKRDPRLAKIPVIIVSSVENQEDQARGMALGADAYIIKRRFEQRELLEAIRQIL